MNIKTWSQRITPESTAVAQLRAMQAEINELRAALQERDAEIDRLKSTVVYRTLNATQGELATQRKVLEQALKYIRKTAVFIPHEYDHEGLEATTAIQGALHGHS